MLIPPWITFVVAGMVILFGGYRLYLGATSDPETLAKRKGLYGMSPRRHMLYGTIYLLMGGFLIAGALGFNLFG